MKTQTDQTESAGPREFLRANMLARVRSAAETFDLIVVGGGATGLGAAVEAAARGHRVVLIERDDFAKGTSSRSTKLVHGGVRYLKQGDVGLVREALRERGRLVRNAPHLVHKTGFVIPGYHWWERGFYGVGLKLYDALAGRLNLGASRWLGRDEVLAMVPTVNRRGLTGGVLYYDGQFDDARLAINLAQTAVDHGAILLNYCPCVGLLKHRGKVVGVYARDAETGERLELRARAVINATGVFVDELRRMDEPAVPSLVTISRGVHLVLPRSFLPGDVALMVPKTADGRVFFAVPWLDRVVLGTTDVPAGGAESEPRASQAEVDFILTHAARYLEKAPVAADVLSVFAGLRPLVKAGGSGSTAVLSRDHTIMIGDSGLLTITGGKWTTYRKMGADVIDRAESIARLPARPSPTESLALHGAGPEGQAGGRTGFEAYGTDAAGLRALVAANPALATRLHPLLPYRQAEVVWHARHEMARTVEDVLARRTRALLLDARASMAAAPTVARLLATELGRGEEWADHQVASYTALAAGYVLPGPAYRPGETTTN